MTMGRFEHLYLKNKFKPFDFDSHTLADNRFYKYRADLGNNKIGLRSISDLEVWFASPRTFNDPFDCLPASSLHSERMLEHTVEMAKTQDEYKGRSDHEIRKEIKNHLEQQSNHHENDNVSVFCLSKSPVEQIMWSYYADEHRGYVLEYEFVLRDEDRSDNWMFPLPVVYRIDRPESPSYNDPLEYYLFKSEQWAHEKEHRIFRSISAHAQAVKPQQLRSIIFGARICADVKADIERVVSEFNQCNEHEIRTYSAKLSLSKYEIYVPEHDLFDQQ